MITPTTSAQNVDIGTLGEFSHFLVQGGVDGLFPIGTTGEFTSLSRDQRRRIVERVVEHSGDLPVLAGCGGTAVETIRQYVTDAADAGADAAVVITPYYQDVTQAGLTQFYEAVATDSPLPLYLYNIPQFTGNHLEPETVAELADHPRIVGVKDSSGDFMFFLEVLEETPGSFDVLQGIPTYSLLSLEHGADGLISGPANVFPRAVSELYEAYVTDDEDRAQKQLSEVVLPVLQSTRSMPMIPALRYLSAKAGRDLGDPLPPLSDLNAQQRRKLDGLFENVVATELTAVSG
jgi:4-hydroxy-tetrahydrodipicolinate synthase